jgi:hypothetical protein
MLFIIAAEASAMCEVVENALTCTIYYSGSALNKLCFEIVRTATWTLGENTYTT